MNVYYTIEYYTFIIRTILFYSFTFSRFFTLLPFHAL